MDKTQIALIIPVILLYLALLLTAIIDLTKNWNTRKNPIIWLIVIIVINIFGPIAYFIFGRKEEGN
ncbi:TPA: PLDc N-terminal domain-containing protein [Listeria monocytogenes]|uniref:Negative regulator of sigma-Y activity n=2 Tax=Listeria monocytogenes TaxID=1639 RepID=A0A9P1YN95_LISMN|nr:PLDc N-terminal domain-containing protein [Listeria monocytogenes]EAA0166785.1 negative regulator of sigma-Y activity [Listeria monocytogenes serotype 1/2a]EAD3236335.1 negative regulator of sigma-Y activity [Listeria monocytogenes CFSAN002202]EAF4519040.1 negative regulator of sigma-Y activity [Listeria monocytogenes serotype 4b]EAG6255652.1 negative regulator of sigma-Y activity [Listeria monocytogenes CFSAN003807]EAG6271081.1 negative regulator of sigma-Y activity [Listeria monocytogenes